MDELQKLHILFNDKEIEFLKKFNLYYNDNMEYEEATILLDNIADNIQSYNFEDAEIGQCIIDKISQNPNW